MLRHHQAGACHHQRHWEQMYKGDSRFHAYPVCLENPIVASGTFTFLGKGMQLNQIPGSVSHRGEIPAEKRDHVVLKAVCDVTGVRSVIYLETVFDAVVVEDLVQLNHVKS